MNARSIVFKDFRNLGVNGNCKVKLHLDSFNKNHLGGLIILIGANNEGKSNVLSGIATLHKNKKLLETDIPYYDNREYNPEISLEYRMEIEEAMNLDSSNIDLFKGKTFGITFTPNCVENCKERNKLTNNKECEKYWQEKLQNTEIYATYDYNSMDSKESRLEIRIISKKHKFIFLCSVEIASQSRKSLLCFHTLNNSFDETKNKEKAIKLNCNFIVHTDFDTPNICNNANELITHLESEFNKHKENAKPKQALKQKEHKTFKAIKSYEEKSKTTLYKTTLPKKKIEKDGIDSDMLKYLQEEFKSKFQYYETIRNYIREDKYSQFDEKFRNISKKYQLVENTYNLHNFKSLYADLQNLISQIQHVTKNCGITEWIDIDSFKYKQEDIDIIEQYFNMPFLPQIIMHEEYPIDDKDLKIKKDAIMDSNFFRALFKILGENYMDRTLNAYKQGDSNRLDKVEEDINERLKSTINKRFNEMYCLNEFIYTFKIRLADSYVSLNIRKNGEPINLNQQSVGFKKFFNLFFNFLYGENIGRGDIVLIDEADAHLSIPAMKDLRSFLKNFGQENGILFIVTTHSPYMLDICHLDEIRIITTQKPNKYPSIINDFSALPENEVDVLKCIKNALGASINIDKRVIFVEGITDYNYLNAFGKFYDYNGNKELVFLPISGLGNCEENGEGFTKEQKEKAKRLIEFAKECKISNPILLVDNDKAGNAMKEGVENDSNLRNSLDIIKLDEADKRFVTIESLFSKEDNEKFSVSQSKCNDESQLISCVFKNMKNLDKELSLESKENFKTLFKYLSKYSEQV